MPGTVLPVYHQPLFDFAGKRIQPPGTCLTDSFPGRSNCLGEISTLGLAGRQHIQACRLLIIHLPAGEL